MKAGKADKGALASLRGKLLHACSAMHGRLGQCMLAAIGDLIQNDEKALSDAADVELSALRALLGAAPWRSVSLRWQPEKVAIISDASWEPGPLLAPACLLCWIIIQPTGAPWGFSIQPPQDLWPCCEPRETQITLAELVCPLLALLSKPELFRHRAVTSFVDNQASLAILVHGKSTAWDLSLLGAAANMLLAELRSTAWFEWVASASNIADGGSRIGPDDPTAAAVGIKLAWADFDSRIKELLLSPLDKLHSLVKTYVDASDPCGRA